MVSKYFPNQSLQVYVSKGIRMDSGWISNGFPNDFEWSSIGWPLDFKLMFHVFEMDFASMSGELVKWIPNRVLMDHTWFPMNLQLISNGFQIDLR